MRDAILRMQHILEAIERGETLDTRTIEWIQRMKQFQQSLQSS